MSLNQVAAMAGVSASTVSRVVNDQQGVAPRTAEAVREAMRKISFTPPARRRSRRSTNGHSDQAKTLAFLIFGTSGEQTAPAFTNLLRGVSIAARENNFDLIVSFVSNPDELPRRITEQRVGGLLLHGERPSQSVQAQLRGLPTVWLMANRFPPRWGDQVMPDNTSIGRLAAEYLHQHGCKSAAYLSAAPPSWGLQVRELAFCQYMSDIGGHVHVLRAALESPSDFWQFDGSAARKLTEQFIELNPRPQGLFLAEDRYAPTVYSTLANHGIALSGSNGSSPSPVPPDFGELSRAVSSPAEPSRGYSTAPLSRAANAVRVISCNNEMPYLDRLHPAPATLDIRAESIGRRGIEQLIWRLEHPAIEERIRKMVEPTLVEPA
jgi:DNA-binding LacI/PurR family transcriptional regulator